MLINFQFPCLKFEHFIKLVNDKESFFGRLRSNENKNRGHVNLWVRTLMMTEEDWKMSENLTNSDFNYNLTKDPKI